MSKDNITGNPNLLSESTVRRFMKLARLEPLGNSFIEENFNQEELEETTDTGDDATSEIQEEVEELEEMAMEPERTKRLKKSQWQWTTSQSQSQSQSLKLMQQHQILLPSQLLLQKH